MPRDGSATRTSIMDAAEALILGRGFAATSVDEIIERAGITKGAFFYHFKSKADLAHALVERFAARDAAQLEDKMSRAERLARDPLQQTLIFVGLFQEEMALLDDPGVGCLFASYCYEAQLFDDAVLALIRSAMEHWRLRFGAKLEEVIALYPPRLPVTAESLADLISTVFEGAFLMSRMFGDSKLVAEQLGHYRNYLELLFQPAPAAR
ncbi:MAG TPA: helix-turn-helix domain-containing protein [Alphaproteobacteria bacterium]|jgi:TetR/AcrR family transcriptional repressor of nem operon